MSALIPRGPIVRRPANLKIGSFDNVVSRADVWVVYVHPSGPAHRDFAHKCETLRVPFAPVRDESGELVTVLSSRKRENGKPVAQKAYPVAYEISAAGDALEAIRGMRDVTDSHPLVRVARLGTGSGGGELTDRTQRILRAERRERGYRAGELARASIRTHSDEPAAPAGAAFRVPDVSELVPASAIADGWRVVGAAPDGSELVVTLRLSDTAQRIRVRVPLQPVSDEPARADADRRRAAELTRLSPPATQAETLRAFGMARA